MEEIINEILQKSDKKIVQRYCKKILKKCSFNSSNDLRNVVDLATWLYVYGENEDAIKICDLIDNIAFSGNYDVWGQIEIACCLKARIAREQGNLEMRQQIIDKVIPHRNPDLHKNLVEWYREILEINIASDDECAKNGIGYLWRIVKIQVAIVNREVGDYPIPNEEIF